MAKVPVEYQDATWDQVDVEGLDRFRDRLEPMLRRGKGLMLLGPPGVGKSCVAALIVDDAIKLGYQGRWEYVPRMLDEFDVRGNRVDVQMRQTTAGLLVWDDFGVDRLSDWQVANLDRVVESRYSMRRPMIVTTNLSREMLLQDESLIRIMDRWKSMLTPVELVGRSRRASVSL